MNLFWQKGFAGTSTRDLQQALDMHPGSIYAAFGSKSGLYLEVLNCYAASMARQLTSHIEQSGSTIAGFKAFFRDILLDRRDRAPSEMCLLVKTRLELAGKDDELCERAHQHLKNTEQLFTRLLDQARNNSELAASTDTLALARHLQIQLMGLRSYEVCKGDVGAIETAIEQLFAGRT